MTIFDRRILMLFIVSAAVAVLPGCQQDAADDNAGTDSTAATTGDEGAANEELGRRFIDEVFNKGNFAFVDSAVAPDCIEHTKSPEMGEGIPGMKKWFGEMRAAFPDLNTTVEHSMSKGDMVMLHIHQTGTNTGPMMGMPATGKKIDIRGIDLLRISNGKAVEHWGYYEDRKFMEQMGMMPATPGAPGAAPTTGGDTAAATSGDTATQGDTAKK